MNKIETLYKEWLSLQPLKEVDRNRLNQKFMLEFDYNSNHIEGNTLTYGQTEMLLLFGKSVDDANMKDLEEMKAHNVGLKMMQVEALEKDKPLTGTFIRQLHQTLLREDYTVYRQLPDGTNTSYVVHAGQYKTRPNSVKTITGEVFEYASPEETPALMTDLVEWYNEAEPESKLLPIEIAALFHYRYIRIHPFEDGNGRIARLLMNYILLRHNYPMIVIKSKDKPNYLTALHKCDITVGAVPSDGANAALSQIIPFVEYITQNVQTELENCLKILKSGTIRKWWYNGEEINFNNENTEKLIYMMYNNPTITVRGISEAIGINKSAVQKQIRTLQDKEYIKRIGGTKGKWAVMLFCTTAKGGTI